jgi:endonuclease YncB( thermonuclease family)
LTSFYCGLEVIDMRAIPAVAFLLVLGIGLSAGALPGYPYPTVWGTVINVLDGNQIVVEVVSASTPDWIVGSQETVRYLGSYASPTEATICGAIATQVNSQMTFGRLVYLEFDQTLRDADGVLLAYVYLDGGAYSMVNAMLVTLGITKATVMEPNTRYANILLALEATAYRLQLGCLAP